MKIVRQRIPDDLYREIHACLPILCVDVVVCDEQGRFVLIKRKNNPERGKWWIPGGRVLKNERVVAAARRKLREELGIANADWSMLGAYDYLEENGYYHGISAHMYSVVFRAEVKSSVTITTDAHAAEWRWFRRVSKSWSPYLTAFLERATSHEMKRSTRTSFCPPRNSFYFFA